MQKHSFRSSAAYPAVKAGGQNPDYARAMLSNLGGRTSEMSAISQYFYNALKLSPWEELSKTFEQISFVEMHHLEIFGDLAVQLGADPRLWEPGRNGMVWWTPEYNHYCKNPRAIIQNALEGELAAIQKYTKQMGCIRDPNIVQNLERIIQDEEVHVELFKQMLTTI